MKTEKTSSALGKGSSKRSSKSRRKTSAISQSPSTDFVAALLGVLTDEAVAQSVARGFLARAKTEEPNSLSLASACFGGALCILSRAVSDDVEGRADSLRAAVDAVGHTADVGRFLDLLELVLSNDEETEAAAEMLEDCACPHHSVHRQPELGLAFDSLAGALRVLCSEMLVSHGGGVQ